MIGIAGVLVSGHDGSLSGDSEPYLKPAPPCAAAAPYRWHRWSLGISLVPASGTVLTTTGAMESMFCAWPAAHKAPRIMPASSSDFVFIVLAGLLEKFGVECDPRYLFKTGEE